MTWSSPRTAAQFYDAIKFSYPTPFTYTPFSDVARRDDGRSLASFSGQGHWRFSATVQENNHEIAVGYQAIIEAVHLYGLSILAYDFRRKFPRLDPDGSIIGGGLAKINSIGSDNSSISLKNLPNFYKLSVGDFFSVMTNAGAYVLLQSLEDINANGSGVTAEFQVIPEIDTGVANNNDVDLRKPKGEFIISPGTYKAGSADLITTTGITLEFEEK